jgi:hypothetical protein
MPKNPRTGVWETYGGVVSSGEGRPPLTGGAGKDTVAKNKKTDK